MTAIDYNFPIACRRRCRSHLCKMSVPFESLAYCQISFVNVSPLIPGSVSVCQISYGYVCFTSIRFTAPWGFRGDPLYQMAAIITGRQGHAVPLNNFTCHGRILQIKNLNAICTHTLYSTRLMMNTYQFFFMPAVPLMQQSDGYIAFKWEYFCWYVLTITC